MGTLGPKYTHVDTWTLRVSSEDMWGTVSSIRGGALTEQGDNTTTLRRRHGDDAPPVVVASSTCRHGLVLLSSSAAEGNGESD